jgi:ribonuclease R
MGRKNEKKTKHKTHSKDAYKGVLEITRSGVGFVVVQDLHTDILVRPNDFNTAMHGDTVRVQAKTQRDGKRLQGEVIQVIERKQSEFIGRLQMNNSNASTPLASEEYADSTQSAGSSNRPSRGFAFFVADGERKMPDIYIPEQNFNGARDADRVVVKITTWEQGAGKRPVGEVVTVLSEDDANDIAMKEILLENGFPLEFDDEVLEEAARMPDVISENEIKKRNDFRKVLTFTIDPVDAKDFDDAISIRVLKSGNYEVGVHIADVAHYVLPNTRLDEAAYEKATSVYLPDRVNPMLPEHISNVLCSLRPKEDKLTFSAVFEMTPKGAVKEHWLGKTIIHSHHRFSYEEVQEIIEKQAGHFSDEVLLLNSIAQRLRKKRFDNGAINFSSTEVRFKLDEKGKPIGVMVKESKEAHQLIEEFMLLANKYVAQYISKIRINKKPLAFPYRVHDVPSEEKLLPFMAFARKFGHKFDTSSPQAIATSFNLMLADVRGTPEQHVLEQLGIRTMAKAIYTSENIGHYGLGFENYCHFTSPIRRYPDILVHRILLEVLEKNIVLDKKLEQKCKHASVKERSAMEAERAANKYKQVEYMSSFLGHEFEGVISGVAAFGFWVETIEHKCEGMVSIASLAEYDEFRLIAEDYCLVGARSGRKFRMGDRVRIQVIAANLDKRQLDYEWVLTPPSETSDKLITTVKSKTKRKKTE